jgi:hypothetical protein
MFYAHLTPEHKGLDLHADFTPIRGAFTPSLNKESMRNAKPSAWLLNKPTE